MNGPLDLVQTAADRLRAERRRFVAATVVRAEKPTSARAGDRAIVLDDGTIVGFVGGDCARASVQLHALAALATGEPRLLRIRPDAPPPSGRGERAGAGAEAGAGTSVSTESGVAAEAGTGTGTGTSAGTEPDASGAVTVHNPCLSGGALEIFLEPEVPPGLVAVHGDGPIARAVGELARWLGYAVEPWTATGTTTLGDATAVVVASHGGGDEATVLTAALAAGVPYVGLVASPRRAAGVLAALDLPPDDLARISTPAGFDIGSRTPEEVALSILAEMVAQRRRGTAPRSTLAPAASSTSAASPAASAASATVDPGPGVEAGARPAADPRPGAVVDPTVTPATAADPVCGMTVAAVATSHHADHEGRRYWFCSSGCRESFRSDPAAYLA